MSRRFVFESAGRTGEVVPMGWRPGGNCAWMVDLGSDLGAIREEEGCCGLGLEGVRRVVRGVSKAAMPFWEVTQTSLHGDQVGLSQAKKFKGHHERAKLRDISMYKVHSTYMIS